MTSSTVQVYNPSPLHSLQHNESMEGEGWVTDINISLIPSPFPMAEPGPPPPPPPPQFSNATLQFQNAVRLVQIYYPPVLFAFGTLGNAFSILILARLPIKNQSTSNYLIAICIAETLFLAYSFYFWLTDFDISLYHIGGWCQFIMLVRHVTDFLAVWFMVSFSADRCIAWCCPKYRDTICTTSRAKLVIISATIIAIVVYVNISIMFGLLEVGHQAFCTTLQEFSQVYKKLDLADVIFNSLLPFCVILALFLVTAVFRCRDRGKEPPGPQTLSQTEDPENPGPSNQLLPQTGVWLTYHLTYFIFMCPEEALRLYDVTESFARGQPIQLHQFLWERMFLLVKQTKYALNLAFLLLSYSGFRQGVRKLVVQLLRRRCRRRVRLSSCQGALKEETVSFNKPAAEATQ